MQIKSVRARWLRVPITPAEQHRSDFGVATWFDSTLVRIETACGIVGYGEGKASVGSVGINAAVVVTVNEELGPTLIGEDPRNVARLWELMYNGGRAHYALEHARGFPILGRRGVTICAISGIDMALWDILGRSLNVPIWRLLGGKTHDSLPVYASGGWAPAEQIGAQLQGYIDQGGFGAVKMRVGMGDGDVSTSVRRTHAARSGLADGVELMVDAHGTFSVAEAKRFAREVTDCRLAWFEEPVNSDNKKGCAEVRASTDIPIAAGESEFTRFDFRDLIELGAVDYLQPDLAICGGITEGLRIAALAETNQLRLAPHLWGGALNFSAGLQLLAVSPSATYIEYSLGANPMLRELAKEEFAVVDGRMVIPDRPGLGVTIDQEFVDKHEVR